MCEYEPERCVVTGGAGFVGSALVRFLLAQSDAEVLVIDKLTYAGSPESLEEAGLDPTTLESANPRLQFLKADICDAQTMEAAFARFKPRTIYHLAAESHVDRSIADPDAFVRTNVTGTATLLRAAHAYWRAIPGAAGREAFRFIQVSTDEVYGSLGKDGLFTEKTPCDPHSPYSASKAAGDHLARAWRRTYGFPAIVTRCSNNYGPWQFPEKFVPRTILAAAAGRPVEIYGNGENIRDWIHVEDHVHALTLVAAAGECGEIYNIGARNERTNLEMAETICRIVDELAAGGAPGCAKLSAPRRSLATFVADRPGHDFRYAIDPSKVEALALWRPRKDFAPGLRDTVAWYLSKSACRARMSPAGRERMAI